MELGSCMGEIGHWIRVLYGIRIKLIRMLYLIVKMSIWGKGEEERVELYPRREMAEEWLKKNTSQRVADWWIEGNWSYKIKEVNLFEPCSLKVSP